MDFVPSCNDSSVWLRKERGVEREIVGSSGSSTSARDSYCCNVQQGSCDGGGDAQQQLTDGRDTT
ncbi:hypothetical protein ALC57_06583 [Trachymyrmex cornetzi]|uniref:Uncharacterized protein n=1 Tax=Trachymyrmex cornetzi TaxID=471704 RepID=A0A151J8D1_9HYME|nr:hypothetical protein ALC57_06583 [Trachymyrmex cornetzi]